MGNPKKEFRPLSVYQALMLAIAFATLVVMILDHKDK